MNAALFEGAKVQLGAMLAAREARMAAQHSLIKKHGLPVVSFTLNIPGPVKRFALADMLFGAPAHVSAEAYHLESGFEAGGIALLRYPGFVCEAIWSKVCRQASPTTFMG